MPSKAQLESDLKDAMRAGDELKKSTLRMIISAIKLAEVDKRGGDRSAQSPLSGALDVVSIILLLILLLIVLLVFGAILLVSSLASRFNPSEERPLPVGPAYCPLCQLTLRPQDRVSHDRVCAGLLRVHKSKGRRTTLVVFHEAGDVRVLKCVGPFACYGLSVSEVSHGNGPDGLRRALQQVGAEMEVER